MNNNISISDLSKIRKLINSIINVLVNNMEEFSKNNSISEENKELIEFLLGSKYNVVSVITKLSNILVKVIPLEEKIGLETNKIEEKLTNDDIEILQRYIDKCNIVFNREK